MFSLSVGSRFKMKYTTRIYFLKDLPLFRRDLKVFTTKDIMRPREVKSGITSMTIKVTFHVPFHVCS